MKIEYHGTQTVITLTPMERIGLLQLVTHTAPSDVWEAAQAVGEEPHPLAIQVAMHELYTGLRAQEEELRHGG